MPKKYTKSKGWYKFYTSSGASARIKMDALHPGEVLIKFKTPDAIQWSFYVPNRVFESQLEVVNYIMRHLEKNATLFRVKNTARGLSTTGGNKDDPTRH